MSAPPFELFPVFATPLILLPVPDAEPLNVGLRQVILQRETSQPSTDHSNLGGWQSTWDMDRWGGAPAIKLLAICRNLANRVTIDSTGKPTNLLWRANMWANVNRSGQANNLHSHPGAYWSAVYYVDDGGIGGDESLAGELELWDPRGPLPVMYTPGLRFAGPGGMAAGATEKVRPKAGLLVMFPSWIMHSVRPYRGNSERISIAFNLCLPS
jgi:uncharacterized protein (TIGR02466 family)